MLIVSKDTTLWFIFKTQSGVCKNPIFLHNGCAQPKRKIKLFSKMPTCIMFYVLHKNSTSSSNITTSTSFPADKQEIKWTGLLQIPTLLNTWTTPFCLQGFSILQHIPPGHILRQQKFPLGPISKKTIIKISNH